MAYLSGEGTMRQCLVRLALTVAVSVLLMLLFARIYVSVPGGETRGRLSAATIKPSDHIFEGVEVRQEFPAEGTRIRSVELQLATYGRQNRGNVTLRVSRRSKGRWEDVALRTMPKRRLVDCAWQTFGFAPALRVKPGQQIALTLTADRGASDAISWWTSPGGTTPNHQLLINGEPRDGYAHFSVDYEPVQGKAGYDKMRPRLWRRLTVFLDPLGQTMLAGGLLLALLCFVHLSMHVPRAQLAGARGDVDAAPADAVIDYVRRACTPQSLRAALDFLKAKKQGALYQQASRHGSLLLVGFCVLVLALSWLARLTTPVNPSADSAILEVAIDDAIRGKLLVGPYSRFGWSHPGPLFFYVLAPLYYLAGRNPVAIHLGMALLNGGSVVASVFVIRKQIGEPGARWAAWIGVLFLIGLSPHGLSQFWNPNALPAPLLLFLTLCAAAITESSPNLLAAVLVGSFLVQTHVGTMGVVGVLLTASAVGSLLFAHLHGTPRPTIRLFTVAACAGLIAWLPPLIQAITSNGGNLLALGRFFFFGAEESARQDNVRLSLIAFVRQAAAVPLGIDVFPLETSELAAGRVAIVALAVALAAGTMWICYQRRVWFGAALASVSLLANMLGIVSVMHARGPLLSYVFWWCAALPVPAWIAWGVAMHEEAEIPSPTAPSATRFGFRLAAFAAAAWFGWSTLHTPLDGYLDSKDAPRIADHVLKHFPAIRREPVELIASPSSYADYSATYATLRRARVNAVVPSTWEGNFGSLHLTPQEPKPRYAVFLLNAGQTWDSKPDDLPDAPPTIIGQVQVWLLDRRASKPSGSVTDQRR